MNPPPTIVHAAADLRRQALLAEAARDRRTAPDEGASRSTLGHAGRLGARRVAALVSWIVDAFEPMPGPAAKTASRMTAGTLPRESG